jgi:hypothetical protein
MSLMIYYIPEARDQYAKDRQRAFEQIAAHFGVTTDDVVTSEFVQFTEAVYIAGRGRDPVAVIIDHMKVIRDRRDWTHEPRI